MQYSGIHSPSLTPLQDFVFHLNTHLEQDGFLSGTAKATALGVHPATWSRAQRGLIQRSPHVILTALARYPDLVRYLPPSSPLAELAVA